MRCDQCNVWHSLDPDDENNIEGYCHRLPPQWIGEHLIDQLGGNDDWLRWSHPITRADDFCGEFQPKYTRPDDDRDQQ